MSDLALSHRRRQPTLLAVAGVAWLAFISALVLINYVALSNSDNSSVVDERLLLLEVRLDAVTERLAQDRRQPVGVPLARYDNDRHALEQRLAAIEHALGERLLASELGALQARLDVLEARPLPRAASVSTPRPRTRAVTSTRTAPAEPDFRVLGIELRGGERFVSILPGETGALPQARLLLIGEEEGGWRLDDIEASSATFRKAGAVHHLPIPVR